MKIQNVKGGYDFLPKEQREITFDDLTKINEIK